MNLPNLVVNILGRSDILSKKDIRMDCRNHVVKSEERRYKSKWFLASLIATGKMGSKKTVHCVNYKLDLMLLNVEHLKFQYQAYFKSPDKEK